MCLDPNSNQWERPERRVEWGEERPVRAIEAT